MSFISKSKLKTLTKCDLQFLLEVKHPELKKYNEQSLFSFNIGNSFEKKVKELFPEGITVSSRKNTDALTETQNKFKIHNTLFEAAFSYDKFLVRTDIAIKNQDSYKFIEVKSGTKLKEDYLIDSVIQYWTIKFSGIKIDKFEIWNVNKNSKDKNNNIKKNDITEFCESKKGDFLTLVEKSKKIVKDNEAKATYGGQCKDCPFFNHCFKNMKDNLKSTYNLPNFDKKWEAINNDIKDINDSRFASLYQEYITTHKLQYSSISENKFLVNKHNIKQEMDKLEYPLNFLDFETVSYAEPLFPKTRPYENCLIQINHYSKESNVSVLLFDEVKKFNKTMIAQKLVNLTDNDGSIIVWDKTLEVSMVDRLIKECSDEVLISQLKNIKERFFDLKVMVENNMYKPEFMGEYNLKKVSRLILNKDFYNNSSIKDGYEVNKSYLKIINKQDNYDQIKKDLIQYGENDVLSLKSLTNWILQAINR
jgi:hypothetical protein